MPSAHVGQMWQQASGDRSICAHRLRVGADGWARPIRFPRQIAYFWPRGKRSLGIGALAAVSTIFHSVQTGCCCLRGPVWTHRLSRCDIAMASAVGAAAARSAPLGPAAAAFALFAVAIACRKRRRYNSYLVTHGLWHILSAWVLREAL